jgi:hypothetical protein
MGGAFCSRLPEINNGGEGPMQEAFTGQGWKLFKSLQPISQGPEFSPMATPDARQALCLRRKGNMGPNHGDMSTILFLAAGFP